LPSSPISSDRTGPDRAPVWLRRRLAAAARAADHGVRYGGRLAVRHGPGWINRHLDPVRIAGVVVAGVAALVLSSWTALLVVMLALAAYEVTVTIIARITPRQPAPRVSPSVNESAA
jgi:hypothetical protein